jgi:hypothetical protein
VLAVGAIALLAAQAEGALRTYIHDRHPEAQVLIGGATTPARVTLTKLTSGAVSFTTQIDGADAETSQERRLVAMPLATLVRAALGEDGQTSPQDQARMAAAFLWMWNTAPSDLSIETSPDNPLWVGLRALATLGRPWDIAAPLRRTDRRVTVSYDFTTPHPDLAGDFATDDGAPPPTSAPGALQWTVDHQVTSDSPESALPQLRWKGALLPPITISALVGIHTGGMPLVGLQSGALRLRSLFNLAVSDRTRVFLIESTPQGGFSLLNESSPLVFADHQDLMHVDIEVDSTYHARIRVNQQPPHAESYALPPGSPITMVIDALQLEAAPTHLDLRTLVITGTLPPSGS